MKPASCSSVLVYGVLVSSLSLPSLLLGAAAPPHSVKAEKGGKRTGWAAWAICVVKTFNAEGKLSVSMEATHRGLSFSLLNVVGAFHIFGR